jgi:23S rRNA (cytidine1920-2'-O)/16S rRNA (cytidine1409-2'-O)-methyltransferase
LTREDIEDDLDFASVDVSFISLTKILLPARNLLKDNGKMVCLIKPQFEAGKEKVTYVKMTPDKVKRVVAEHLQKGNIVTEYTIGNAQ